MYTRHARENERKWLYETLRTHNRDTTDFSPTEYVLLCAERESKPLAIGRFHIHKQNPVLIELTSFLCLQETSVETALTELCRHIANELQHDTETHLVYTITNRQKTFTEHNFEDCSNNQFPSPFTERLEEKQTHLEQDLIVMKAPLEELKTTDSTAPNVKDIESEKEALGFTEEDDLTYKYSVE